MGHRRGDWSELYPEILSEIASRLGTKQDILNFRAVCKKWRISFSVSSQALESLPLLHPLLPLKFLNGYNSDLFSIISYGNPLFLVANSVYLLRPRTHYASSKPWLVTIEEFDRGKLRLRFPLTRIAVKDFPKNLPRKTLNLSDFHVLAIASGYNIRIPEREGLEEDTVLNRSKVVLFLNPNLLPPMTVDDCTTMVLFSQGSLAWARVKRGGDQWGYLSCRDTSLFDDIVNFKGCVYAVDRTGRAFAIHYDSICSKGKSNYPKLRVDCIVNDEIFSGCDSDRRKRLVVDSSGVLYLVYRGVYCVEKIHFKVYKLDEECCKWDEVSSLGDNRVLFVGDDWCFFGSAADFRGCRGNCIFFLKNCFPTYTNGVSSDKSFFEGASKELQVGVFHLEDGDAGLISAYPAISDILWPPPAWVSHNSSSSTR